MNRHAVLRSAKTWAAELGISKFRAGRVKVHLWACPSCSGDKGKAVDRLRPGASARILDEKEFDYLVQGRKIAGWISKIQVAEVTERKD